MCINVKYILYIRIAIRKSNKSYYISYIWNLFHTNPPKTKLNQVRGIPHSQCRIFYLHYRNCSANIVASPLPPFCEGEGKGGTGFFNSMKSEGNWNFSKSMGERGIFEIFIGGKLLEISKFQNKFKIVFMSYKINKQLFLIVLPV